MQEIDIPALQSNDLLVKVGAAGYCHTDYQVYEGVYGSKCPLTPSHEPVGTVVQTGPEVHGWQAGDRVGVLLFRHACGKCLGCRKTLAAEGRIDLRFCEDVSMAGLNDDGAMAQYIVADASNTVKLPDSVPFEQGAPLMCAGVRYSGLCLGMPLTKSDNCLGRHPQSTHSSIFQGWCYRHRWPRCTSSAVPKGIRTPGRRH